MIPSITQVSEVEDIASTLDVVDEVEVKDAYEPTICGLSIIDKLPYDVLLAILLHMGLKEIQSISRV